MLGQNIFVLSQYIVLEIQPPYGQLFSSSCGRKQPSAATEGPFVPNVKTKVILPDGQMDGQMEGQTDGQMDGQTDGQTDGPPKNFCTYSFVFIIFLLTKLYMN